MSVRGNINSADDLACSFNLPLVAYSGEGLPPGRVSRAGLDGRRGQQGPVTDPLLRRRSARPSSRRLRPNETKPTRSSSRRGSSQPVPPPPLFHMLSFLNFFLNSDVICHRLPHVLIDLQFQSFYIKLQGCHNDGTKI